jgi:hypothetical protein
MDRKLGEFSKFLVFGSLTESQENSPVFACSLLLFALFQFLDLFFRGDYFVVSNVFMAVFTNERG